MAKPIDNEKRAANFIDRTGNKYNSLTCLEYEKRGSYIYWKCRCDCGKTTWVRSQNLVSGAVKSCGCAGEHVNRVHGMSHTRLHGIWSRMHQRCENPNSDNYKWYGAEGKCVCPDWCGTQGFINFMEWSLANGYADNLTIDRIDGSKDYSPDNCRWITQKEQALNTRQNRRFTVNGETLTVKELSEKYTVPYWKIKNRLKWNWPIEEALEIIPHHDRRKDIKRDKDGKFYSE